MEWYPSFTMMQDVYNLIPDFSVVSCLGNMTSTWPIVKGEQIGSHLGKTWWERAG